MKKGFTLVELIAVVVILGIILVIAVPRITDVINNAKINTFIKNEKMLLRATKNYLVSNNEKMPTEIGSAEEVTLIELQTEELIQPIKSPFNNNNCSGYVLVTNIGDNSYDYTPHLNCVDPERGSAATDGLVLHYKFDDFQEPTENIWITQMNQLSDIRVQDNSTNSFIQPFIVLPYTTSDVGENLILSFDMEYLSHDGCDGRLLYWEYQKYLSGSFQNGFKSLNVYPSDNGKKLEKEAVIPLDDGTWDHLKIKYSTAVINGVHANYNEHMVDVWMRNIQLEQKPYATPFVNGIREGIVKDHSMNNNHATLNENTPRWIPDSKIGSGAYEFFKGEEKRIKIPDPGLYTKTISFWVKVKTGAHTSSDRVPFIMYNNGAVTGSGDANQIFLGMQNNRFQMHGWGTRDPQALTNINDGNWHHLVWQMNHHPTDGTQRIMNMWVNGVKEVNNYNYNEGNAFGPVSDRFWWIGYNSRSYSPYIRDAGIYIDDVRFYDRMLIDQEVKLIYNTNK